MNKTGKGKASTGGRAAGSKTSAGTEPENTKYAKDAENTKYAQDADNTKYAQDAENTKYARDAENTKYAQDADNTKYARGENTKYAGSGSGKEPSPAGALARRRAIDAAVEEALMSVTAAVDRVHPGITGEARARLVGTMLDKFGGDLLEAHLDVITSSDADD